MDICEQIKERVISAISDYDAELYEAKDKKIFFLNKVEDLDSLEN